VNELALFAGASRYGMTFAIDFSIYRRKMFVWTKNTDMAKSAIALFAGRHSSRETKGVNNNAVRTLVAGRFRPGKQFALAQSVESNSHHRGQDMKRVRGNVELRFACLARRSIQWSKSGSVLPSSVVRLSQGACETRLIALRRFLGIQSRSCALISNGILSRVCHGKTTAKEVTNGA
jgi:hypothetical protein